MILTLYWHKDYTVLQKMKGLFYFKQDSKQEQSNPSCSFCIFMYIVLSLIFLNIISLPCVFFWKYIDRFVFKAYFSCFKYVYSFHGLAFIHSMVWITYSCFFSVIYMAIIETFDLIFNFKLLVKEYFWTSIRKSLFRRWYLWESDRFKCFTNH